MLWRPTQGSSSIVPVSASNARTSTGASAPVCGFVGDGTGTAPSSGGALSTGTDQLAPGTRSC
ncbi:MAG: hypothetical protein HS111_28655 [Kofleriaceae bacterium]|nr:hypothetical protein [Kofleriaceae bacterium]